jgi:hypothetical protein
MWTDDQNQIRFKRAGTDRSKKKKKKKKKKQADVHERNGERRRRPNEGSNRQTAPKVLLNILALRGSKSSSWLDQVKGKERQPHGRGISSTTQHRSEMGRKR